MDRTFSKPGGSSLVHETFEVDPGVRAPGKRTLTEQLGGASVVPYRRRTATSIATHE